jgi:hypothetical protein
VLSALALTAACVGALVGCSAEGGKGGATPSHGGSGSTQTMSSGGQSQASGGAGSTVAAPTALPAENACSAPGSPGPRVLRRLTATEFSSSIADLFGDKMAPVTEVFSDSRVLGFTVDSDSLRVQDLNADQLMTNAEAVANWAVTTPAQLSRLTQLATCSTHDANCAKLFVKNFGRKAFRTAIPDNDPRIASYSSLFMAEADFATGVSTVISAMLQSPHFVYRSEIGAVGAAGSTIPLTPYEVASGLSYLLTGSTPDDTLLKAADMVQANDVAGLKNLVDEQSARLLASPSAENALMGFMSGWLGLDRLYSNVKDDTVRKLTADDRATMAAETRKLILGVWGGASNNTVGDLFGANDVAPQSGHDGGILGQASILVGYSRANGSSPTQRGHLVRSRLLCQAVPAPPPGLDTKFTPNADLKTTRDQYMKGHAAPDHQPCYGCHKGMDPIGVAFEHYDAFGTWRDTENGVNIDATGTIYSASPSDGDVPIDGLSGPKGLQAYLAQSEDVRTCVVRYWSYYAFGRASWDQDGCTYDAIRQEASGKSFALKSVLTAILHAPRFTTRVNDQ